MLDKQTKTKWVQTDKKTQVHIGRLVGDWLIDYMCVNLTEIDVTFQTEKDASELLFFFIWRRLTQVRCDPLAGEKHNCEPYLQDWQSSPRAGLLAQSLQPGGLCGAVPEDEATSPQQASCRPAVPSAGPAVDVGSQPAATDATLSNNVMILEGRLFFFCFFSFFRWMSVYVWLIKYEGCCTVLNLETDPDVLLS